MRFVLLGAVFVFGLTGQTPPAPVSPASPVSIDLHAAIDRAKAYSQQFLASGTAAALARQDVVQAKSALLPSVSDFSQYIYTQGNGTPTGTFVANDGVHIYNQQALVHQDLFPIARRADYRRTIAAEAAARARQDIALRGLAATVMQNYYAVLISQRHLENARRSLDEAARFLDITQKQERGGEVARADVVKARLQLQQRQRDLLDSEVGVEKAKVQLGVMLFPDVDQPFTLVDDLSAETPLPPLAETRTAAFSANPDIRAAEAGVDQAGFALKSAKGLYYPNVALDYFFGIDANQFAVYSQDRHQNIGSVVQGTLTVPVWNWGATRSKVEQAELQKRQAEADLSIAKRQVQANLDGAYLEARAARQQLDSLRESVNDAAESLRLTLLRYEAGEAVALEVADAQNTAAQSRNASDDGLTRYRLALANLQVLTGRF